MLELYFMRHGQTYLNIEGIMAGRIDTFSNYSKNEKILVVTHNALIRNLKRLFFHAKGSEEPKNLEIVKITREHYNNLLLNDNKIYNNR